jgi:uncharacterized protein (TIGR02145 family)
MKYQHSNAATHGKQRKNMLLIQRISTLLLMTILLFMAFSCAKEEDQKVTSQMPPPAPCSETPVVLYGGMTYPTIQIGNQCWMAQNLNIGDFLHIDENMANNGKIEKYCYWNDSILCERMGGLYQWDEMMQYAGVEGAQGICPEGWRIPTLADFDTLLKNTSYRSRRLYDNTDYHWFLSSEDSLKVYGFNLRTTGGYNAEIEEFAGIYKYARTWTATLSAEAENEATVFQIDAYYSRRTYEDFSKNSAYPVRCIKNE